MQIKEWLYLAFFPSRIDPLTRRMGLFNYYTQVHPGGQLTFIEGKISDFQPHNRIGSGKNILRMESFIKALIKSPFKVPFKAYHFLKFIWLLYYTKILILPTQHIKHNMLFCMHIGDKKSYKMGFFSGHGLCKVHTFFVWMRSGSTHFYQWSYTVYCL